MSVFAPIPYCFDKCSFVILLEVWDGYASYFVADFFFFPHDIALEILDLLMVPYKFLYYLS